MSLAIENLKFTIFGSGHDYTLNNSGTGEGVRVFSHPYLPLNSVHYAGMWLFYVADENGDLMDAVKDDLAHCTFTPALGATFDTEGETEISVHYHREYIHDESTLVVDKTFKTKVGIVNHGTVVKSASRGNQRYKDVLRDIYSDGYCFWHPYTANEVLESYYHAPFSLDSYDRGIKKSSSIPWRAIGLGHTDGYAFGGWNEIIDISELAFADVSNVTCIYAMWETSAVDAQHPYPTYCKIRDLSPIADWDVSNVKTMIKIFAGLEVDDLTAFSKWNVSNVEYTDFLFANNHISSFHGVESWRLSKCKNFSRMFLNYNNASLVAIVSDYLPSLEPLKDWDFSSAENFDNFFGYTRIQSLHGVENWDVSKVKSMKQFMQAKPNYYSLIENFSEFTNWNPHIEGNGLYRFIGYQYGTAYPNIKSLYGLQNFDISNATDLREAFFGCDGLIDISALNNWDFSSVTNMKKMFYTSGSTKDASSAQNWNVQGSSKDAFNNNWINRPTWN